MLPGAGSCPQCVNSGSVARTGSSRDEIYPPRARNRTAVENLRWKTRGARGAVAEAQQGVRAAGAASGILNAGALLPRGAPLAIVASLIPGLGQGLQRRTRVALLFVILLLGLAFSERLFPPRDGVNSQIALGLCLLIGASFAESACWNVIPPEWPLAARATSYGALGLPLLLVAGWMASGLLGAIPLFRLISRALVGE